MDAEIELVFMSLDILKQNKTWLFKLGLLQNFGTRNNPSIMVFTPIIILNVSLPLTIWCCVYKTEFSLQLCDVLEGWDQRVCEIGGYMYNYGWFMLYGRNQQNTVKQLSSN